VVVLTDAVPCQRATVAKGYGFCTRTGATVEHSLESVVAAGAVATYEALTAVVQGRHLTIVEADARHHRLSFESTVNGGSGETRALCAVLDVGHGLSKVVAVCFDEADGTVVTPDTGLQGLFVEVERRLQGEIGKTILMGEGLGC
jgi:hypothetical protein